MGKKAKKKYLDQTGHYAKTSVSFDKMPEVSDWYTPDGTLLHQMAEEFKAQNWYLDHDPVNHPSHYTSQVPGVECQEVIGWFPHHVGAAMKYLWRYQSKGDPIENLRKASKFIEFEIARLTKEGVD